MSQRIGRGRIGTPSQNQTSAVELLEGLEAVGQIIAAIDARGGIVAVANEAQLNEAGRAKLTALCERVWHRTRSYVANLGDDKRARGLATPLCWLPDPPAGGGPT
jgi:hypothetical protein